jgi:monomeric isocitrate dehydrogenase
LQQNLQQTKRKIRRITAAQGKPQDIGGHYQPNLKQQAKQCVQAKPQQYWQKS